MRKRPAWHWEEREYRDRRLSLLIQARVLRRTAPAKRVIKSLQREMRQLRTTRRMMLEADG